MGDRPDWLPEGWKVSIGVRKTGKKDKYYIDPKGHKFASMPEVLRYLENAGIKSAIDVEKTVAEKLPPGWIKEIRSKKRGRKTRRDPYYIDPVSGRHFRSMQEVFRYLEARDSGKVESNPKGKGLISVELGDHSKSSSTGTKRKRLADSKTDKHVIGGQISKSGLDGNATNNADMLAANHIKQREMEDDSVAGDLPDKLPLVKEMETREDRTRKNYKLAANEIDKNVKVNQSLKSDSKGATMNNVNASVLNQYEHGEKDDSVAGDFHDKPPKVNGMEQHEDTTKRNVKFSENKVDKDANGDQSLKSGSKSAETNHISMLETNYVEQSVKQNDSVAVDLPDVQLQANRMDQHENKTSANKRKKLNNKRVVELPRRTSKRLAGVEVDQPVELKARNQDRAAAELSGEAEVNVMNKFGNFSSSKEQEEFRAEKSANDEQEDSGILALKDPFPPKTQSEHLSVDSEGFDKHEMPTDTSINDILMDPCIEFAIKTLTGAIPIEDLNKVNDSSSVSSLALPSAISCPPSDLPPGDVWADPCFEFAVKTLTGDFSMVDSSCIQTSSQHSLGLSETSRRNVLTLPKFRLDDMSQSNRLFSRLDGAGKPCVRQQAIRAPPFPRNGNGC